MRHVSTVLALILIVWALTVAGCASSGTGIGGPTMESSRAAKALVEVGEASYYSSTFNGRRMAGGAIYDDSRLTAAHRTLPFGTRVRVTNLANGRSVVVTIQDRGPAVRHRVIDLSGRAARELGFVREGVTQVRMEVISG
jgi:rare lipoprotein A